MTASVAEQKERLTVTTRPFPDQKPGTSGLRKKVTIFQQPNYAENFIQSTFDTIGEERNGATLIVGGDGRYYNRTVIQQIIRMAAANGFNRLIIGQGGIVSTPAASHLIRKYGAVGGFILSASHNPGGPDGDFGIKFNGSNGGPATETVTEAIYQRSREIENWHMVQTDNIPLDDIGSFERAGMTVQIIDPVFDYADLMETLFDFDMIRSAVKNGFAMIFDAMNAVTGPYATEILENRIGFAKGTVRNGVPLEDFGGGHPDPNLVHLSSLHDEMMAPDAPDLAAASDGDGDRNLIIGRDRFISPSDSLAMLAANAQCAPGYAGGLAGLARSMPTSRAVDRVAEDLDIPCFETPTGWKFFGNLLDAGKISFCGEESAGTGSDHVREKDGLWAVLLWINILANRRLSVAALAQQHWEKFGRNYYQRHDYEGLESDDANVLMTKLIDGLETLIYQEFGDMVVSEADEFSYRDPVDQIVSEHQGIRVQMANGSRIIYRLSGTGTSGATLRVYLEHYEPASGQIDGNTAIMLAPLAGIAASIANIEQHTGRNSPSIVT